MAVVLVGATDRLEAAGQKPDKKKALESLASKQGITEQSPGMAMCTFEPKGYNLVWFAGLANLKTKTAIGPTTTFELASCSKPFTATAILMLVEQGKVALDDLVRKHIPELPVYHKDNPVRIQHLLNHTGGLPDYLEMEDVKGAHKGYFTNNDYMPEFAKQRKKLPPLFSPNDKYDYSNTGFMLLATVIERASGKSYGEFLKENIFAPLKMTRTFVYETPKSVPKLGEHAMSYELKKKSWDELWGCPPHRSESQLAIGDGGVWTCLEDMLEWDKAIRERKLLKPATWTAALTPSKTKDGKTNDYGLGWGLSLDGNKVTGFGHTGSWGGFRTLYWLDLEKNRTTIVLGNRADLDTEKVETGLNRIVEK